MKAVQHLEGNQILLFYSSSTRNRWPHWQRTQDRLLPSPWLASDRYLVRRVPRQAGHLGRSKVTVSKVGRDVGPCGVGRDSLAT